jgi:hypothetical protein
MIRSCWTLLLVVVAGRAAAQEPKIPVRKLTVSPAAAPVPALRYKLLPDLRDRTPGNAALLYYRAFAPDWMSFYQRERATLADKLNAAVSAPLAEMKKADVEWVRNSPMLQEVDRASRRAYCDWELTPRVREDGISFLLPDMQSLRLFGMMLAVRGRLELADGQFDKAAYTFQTGLQMGRYAGHGPTLIQGLVGVAITTMTLNQVEEWVGVSGSPNLYWALTELPQPFVDLRMGFQGEKLMLENLLPGFREALANGHMRPMPLDQLRDMVAKLGQLLTDVPPAPTVVFVAIVAKNYGPAKEYLKGRGWPAAEVEALPAVQVVLLHEAATYDRLYDEMLKWQGQPYAIARTGLERADRELKDEVARTSRQSLASLLLPAVSHVFIAQARTDRNINLLRAVEAIRMYAAVHSKLPEKLADVTEVPVPTNPFTGQPFDYRLDGDKAILTAPPPAGEPPHEGNSRRYEIKLAK